MEKVSLYIKRLNTETEEVELFPSSAMPAVVATYEYTAQRMGGAPTIEAELMYPTCLDELWRSDGYGLPYVEFRDEKFYVSQVPSSSKDNTDQRYKHEITFTSERIVLENIYAYDVVSTLTEFTERTDVYRSNTTTFSFYGDINEFVARINESLVYSGVCDVSLDDDGNIVYDGYYVVVDDGVETESLEVSFEDMKIAEALQEIYNVYGLTYYWDGKVCHVGMALYVLEDALEYGSGNPLLSIEKENANTALVDRVTGYGGSTNLQYYYPNESSTGTAIFETTNIESTEVSSVDLSTIIKYTSDYVGTWIYCTYKQTEPEIDILQYFTPRGALTYNDTFNGQVSALTFDNTKMSLTLEVIPEERDLYTSQIPTATLYWQVEIKTKAEGDSIDWTDIENIILTQTAVSGQDGTTWTTAITPSMISVICDGEETEMTYTTGVSATTVFRTSYTLPTAGMYYVRIKFDIELDSVFSTDSAGSTYTIDYAYEITGGEMIFGSGTDTADYFLYGATGGDTDEYETIPYTSSGIEFLSASEVPSVQTSFSLEVLSMTQDEQSYFYTLYWHTKDSGLEDAATITITGRQWMTACTKLMPSIYRETLGADRFYPAVNYPTEDGEEDDRYIIPDSEDDEYYEFENEYERSAPHEAITEDSDIYPTIKNVYNADGELIGEILDIAYDENDSDALTDSSDEDNPEYIHSYFYIKLHVFNGDYGFNLFSHASYSEEAYLTLTSGNCSACTFQIAIEKEANDDNTGYNFYNPVLTDGSGNLLKQTLYEEGDEVDDEGNGYLGDYILPIGQKSQYTDEQQDTSAGTVWIAVKKDNETFGVVMPNVLNSYYPSKGDGFVLTGIGLPQVYIDAAERKLDEYLIQYMSENNTETFTYTVKFSRIWIATHETLASQINENSLITVKYNGVEHVLFVSSYTCKADDNILYEIEVELSDELELNQSTLQTEVDGLKGSVVSLSSLLAKSGSSSSTTSSGITLATAKKYFLRKDIADTATGLITFLDGIAFGDGSTGVDADGNAVLGTLKNGLQTITDSIQSDNYDYDTQTGVAVVRSDSGKYTINTTNLNVWGKAVFNTLEIRRLSAVGGSILLSAASSTIKAVADYYVGSEMVGWKCWYLADDGTMATQNGWQLGDQARCQSFNISEGTYSNVGNTDYWRCVIAVSEENEVLYDDDGNALYDGQAFGWVVLSKSNCQLTDYGCTDEDAEAPEEGYEYLSIPSADDVIVLLGHQLWTDDDGNTETSDDVVGRQSAILMSASDDDSPKIVTYGGIYTYSLDGCDIVNFNATSASIRSSKFTWISSTGSEVPAVVDMGEWTDGCVAGYYTRWSYDGDLWEWREEESTTSEPSEENGWVRITYNNTGRVLKIEQALGGFMYKDETETITLSVWSFNGGTDYTDEYTFSVERDSGDESSDAVWNNSFAAVYSGGNTFTLTFSDLNFTSGSRTTKFWVTATEVETDETIEEVIEY